jgi:hypothetical protein
MKTVKKKAKAQKGAGSKAKKDYSASYNRYKFFGKKQYTGMKIGGGHKWYYDKGVWHDKKITPDQWLINYEVTKRRAGVAPEGSGAPVGTEYHWFILSHQMVKKLDANSYTTAMNGYKFKLAHKRAATGKWNISDKTQRDHLIKILQEYIKELEAEPIEAFIEQEQNQIKKKGEKKTVKKSVEPETLEPVEKAKPAKKKSTKLKPELAEV